MAVSKLTSADKAEMVRLYRETSASFSQLAKQFGISVSTVSRLLQEGIPEEEYRQLVSHKQSHRPKRGVSDLELTPSEPHSQLELIPEQTEIIATEPPLPSMMPLAEIVEDLVDIDDEFDADASYDEDEGLEGSSEEFSPSAELLGLSNPLAEVEVHPFSEAVLPDLCYMIVDKAHEIVTRPLQAFKDLGKIPETELQSVTVPIFDNHRVVRRFCSPHQLIIKFPSDLIFATKNKLIQKGITRLLISGQVYALS